MPDVHEVTQSGFVEPSFPQISRASQKFRHFKKVNVKVFSACQWTLTSPAKFIKSLQLLTIFSGLSDHERTRERVSELWRTLGPHRAVGQRQRVSNNEEPQRTWENLGHI